MGTQGVVVTVSNKEFQVIKYNYFLDKFNKYKNIETYYGNSGVTTTVYNLEDINDLQDYHDNLAIYKNDPNCIYCKDLNINDFMYNKKRYGNI